MERLILNKLLEWKNSPYRKPLILKGVRQVGKTWILKEFGKRYQKIQPISTLMKMKNTNSSLRPAKMLTASCKT